MAVYDQVKWFGIKPTVKAAEEPGKVVDVAAADTEILAANDDRTAFTLAVRGSVNVFLKLGTVAAVTHPEFEPGDVLSSDDYTGPVHGIVAAGTGKVHVFEV
jgi:hypothetical protein